MIVWEIVGADWGARRCSPRFLTVPVSKYGGEGKSLHTSRKSRVEPEPEHADMEPPSALSNDLIQLGLGALNRSRIFQTPLKITDQTELQALAA